MPINGISGTTNTPYNVNEVNSTEPISRVPASAENNPSNRENTVNPGNRRDDSYATNSNTINSSNTAPDARVAETNASYNTNLGRTIDLIA